MLHSHTKIWIHIIWTTYNRERILYKELRIKLFKHLIDYAQEIGVVIERMNVQHEHVHLLVSLPANKDVASVVKGLKGESSRWINENGLVKGRFMWQRGYGAFSVSASVVENVKAYIEKQEEHHHLKTFQEEYEEWKTRYKIDGE